jgi:hypothetical protein
MRAARLTHPRLMRESERRVEAATESDNPTEALVANRLLADGRSLRIWETEHARYMRGIARERHRQQQLAALRSASFDFIHRKALFDYLRAQAPRGEERRRIVALFHVSRAYSNAVVAEHHSFIRSTCSHLCANHIAAEVLGDPGFAAPFEEYERLFFEYFRFFCLAQTAGTEAGRSYHSLLPYLKLEVSEQRRLIVSARAVPAARRLPPVQQPAAHPAVAAMQRALALGSP